MTRQEFMDSIEEWGELIDFCNDYGLSTCEDIYDVDEVVNYVSDIIRNQNSYDAMSSIQYLLEYFDVDDSYFVLCDGRFDEVEDFDDYKVRAANEYEENNDWDDEDEDEEYYEDDEYDEYDEEEYYEDTDESDWYEYNSDKSEVDASELENLITM